MRAVMRTGDAEIGQQERRGFGFHRTAPIGVQRELARRHVVFRYRVVEQRLEQGRTFGIGYAPADDAAAGPRPNSRVTRGHFDQGAGSAW